MQVSPHPIAAGPAAPQPVAPPGAGNAAPGQESPFAKLLSAQPQPADPPKSAATEAAKRTDKPAEDHAKTDPAQADDPTADAQRPGGARARLAKPIGPREPPQRVDITPQAMKETSDSGIAVPGDAAKEEAKASDAGSTAMDPAWAQWLASQNRPAVTDPLPAPGGGMPGAAAADGLALDSTALKGQPQPALAGQAAGIAAARNLKAVELNTAGLELPQAAGERSRSDSAMISALEERQTLQHPGDRAAGVDNVLNLGALAATPTANASSRAEPAAAVLPVNLPTVVTSPEFKGALGMQVSVLARDGIQHAELHLNPAEMGPISVQIALAGTQAQVDFGADSATTRQIIEAGLPELASALRDAGLTLSGGGVSQHSRGQSQGDAAEHRRSGTQRLSGADDTGTQVARRVNLRLPLGAVDLYA